MPVRHAHPPTTWRAGTVAAGVALVVGWGAHRALASLPFAPFALADRVIRVTPGGVATYLIDHLHHAAQTLLASACVAALGAAGALAARLEARSRWAPAAAFGALVLGAGLLAPVQRSTAGALAAAALIAAVYGAALHALSALTASGRGAAFDPGRRRALQQLGALAGLATVANVVGPLLGGGSGVRLLDFRARHRGERPPFLHIDGLSPEVTPTADHYVVDIDISDPVVDGAGWRLHVSGDVDRPLALSFDELQERFDAVAEYSMLTCISNEVGGPLVGNSLWQGVRLRELLAAAGPDPDAWGLAVNCADGYSAGIPLAAASHRSALVAIAQNGEPLTREHGFPCRLRLPALYGMLNPKWVTDIRVVSEPYIGYWAEQGWSRTAIVRTEARIDTPHTAQAGVPTWVGGVAWAGVRGVRAVEVSTDGGESWQAARLRDPLSPWAWTEWGYRWTPLRPGKYAVVCRATDGRGERQDARARPPHPSGASGYPRREVTVS